MERLVPIQRENWNFFDRQRQVFSNLFKGDDNEFSEFDKELERIRSEMFTLKTQDFGDASSLYLKPDRPIVSDEEGNKRLSLR